MAPTLVHDAPASLFPPRAQVRSRHLRGRAPRAREHGLRPPAVAAALLLPPRGGARPERRRGRGALFPVVGASRSSCRRSDFYCFWWSSGSYRAFVKSGLWVREGVPLYAYCDRGHLGRANVLFRVFGEQRRKPLLPTESRPAPAEAERSEAERSSSARERATEALETMFRQFLPQTDAILMAAFLGTQGLWGIGTHSFACVTQRRVVSLRRFRVVFQRLLGERERRSCSPALAGMAFLLSGAWVLWPVFAAASQAPRSSGSSSRSHRSRSSSLLPREGEGARSSTSETANYLFCDRGKLSVANACYRLERSIAAGSPPPLPARRPAPAVIRPGRAACRRRLAPCGLLLRGGAGAAIWATRGGDASRRANSWKAARSAVEDVES